MTDTPELTPKPSLLNRIKERIPRLNSRWWTGLLALSLVGNFMIAGLAMGNRYGGGHRVERMAVGNLGQLVPRDFFMELSRERRRELTSVVRKQMGAMRESNENVALSNAIADALEKDDTSALKVAIDGFTTGPSSAAGRSGLFAMDVLAKLTTEERKLLASSIRNRALQQQNRKKKN